MGASLIMGFSSWGGEKQRTVGISFVTENAAVSVIVGDFQRMDLYAKKGYQTPQYIPPEAWEAFHALVAMGFDKQLAK